MARWSDRTIKNFKHFLSGFVLEGFIRAVEGAVTCTIHVHAYLRKTVNNLKYMLHHATKSMRTSMCCFPKCLTNFSFIFIMSSPPLPNHTPKGVSWPWPKVISTRSMSQCTHTQNVCPGHNCSLPSWIWIIFHWHNCCPGPKGVSWPWPKVISKDKVTVHTYWKCLSGPYSSLPFWIWIIHTIVVHDPRVCHDLESRSYLQGLSHSLYFTKILVRPINPFCNVVSLKIVFKVITFHG